MDLHGHVDTTLATTEFEVILGAYAPSACIARHDHERASLCIALTGGYEEVLDTGVRQVLPGTILIHPEGEAHANRHDPLATNLLTIEFTSPGLAAARAVSPAFNESWTHFAPTLLPQGFQLARLLDDHTAAGRLVIETSIWRIIDALFSSGRHAEMRPRWLDEVRERLDAAYAAPPSLSELACAAQVHPMHLCRSFRRWFGVSIGQHVANRRNAEALMMLGQSCGLAEIAAATGFADQSHMTREIGRSTGRSPGAWRRVLASSIR